MLEKVGHHPRMMYQFQTLSMHLINQDHWIQLIQGLTCWKLLSRLCLRCCYSIPRERFIGNFLIYLKGQLILKTYATVTLLLSDHFILIGQRLAFYKSEEVNCHHKISNVILNLKIKKVLKISYRFLLYQCVWWGIRSAMRLGYISRSKCPRSSR